MRDTISVVLKWLCVCVEINYSMCNSNKMIIITGLQTRARPRELYNKSNDDNSRAAPVSQRSGCLYGFLGCAFVASLYTSPGVRNTRKMHRRPIKNALLMRDVCNTQRCSWDIIMRPINLSPKVNKRFWISTAHANCGRSLHYQGLLH